MDLPVEDRRKPGRPPGPATRKITVTVPLEQYEEIHRLSLSYPYIVSLGLRAHHDNPQLIERVRATEEGNQKLQAKLTRLAVENAQMGQQLKQLGVKVDQLEADP